MVWQQCLATQPNRIETPYVPSRDVPSEQVRVPRAPRRARLRGAPAAGRAAAARKREPAARGVSARRSRRRRPRQLAAPSWAARGPPRSDLDVGGV